MSQYCSQLCGTDEMVGRWKAMNRETCFAPADCALCVNKKISTAKSCKVPHYGCRRMGNKWETCRKSRGSTLLRELVAMVSYILPEKVFRQVVVRAVIAQLC
jgi:hypothetical protein